MTNYPEEIFTLFDALEKFGEKNSNIKGILLIGSYAHGGFEDDSDIDLIILSENPNNLLHDREWLKQFGTVINTKVDNSAIMKNLRVRYNDKLCDFFIATPDWADINPLDLVTKQSIKKGAKIIFDPEQILKNLLEKMY